MRYVGRWLIRRQQYMQASGYRCSANFCDYKYPSHYINWPGKFEVPGFWGQSCWRHYGLLVRDAMKEARLS